ncbi:hypothetical protein AUP68_09191 [Ilyonectria robusta]
MRFVGQAIFMRAAAARFRGFLLGVYPTQESINSHLLPVASAHPILLSPKRLASISCTCKQSLLLHLAMAPICLMKTSHLRGVRARRQPPQNPNVYLSKSVAPVIRTIFQSFQIQSAPTMGIAQELGDQHQTLEPDNCRETEWGPEFFPEGETPGTPTVMNSPTRYERFVSILQSGPPQEGSGHASSPTWKPRERKSTGKPSTWPRESSYRIQKKQGKKSRKPQQDHHVAGPAIETTFSPGLCPNKYLDSDGDLILPTVDELCGMTDSDQEEWQRACETSR